MTLMSWLFGQKPALPLVPAETMSVMMGDETRPLLRGPNGWVEPPQAHQFLPQPRSQSRPTIVTNCIQWSANV